VKGPPQFDWHRQRRQVRLSRLGATVREVAEAVCVEPGDVLALLRMYPDDVTDLGEEEGVLSKLLSKRSTTYLTRIRGLALRWIFAACDLGDLRYR
jgi:hypothetical protein